MTTIEMLGFKKNREVINGFRPHYKRGTDLLFLIKADYWPSKINKIDRAFTYYKGKVYGVLTDESPNVSDKAWVTAPQLTLLKLDPVSVGKWAENGGEIEYVETYI